jgi:IS30 family transposase
MLTSWETRGEHGQKAINHEENQRSHQIEVWTGLSNRAIAGSLQDIDSTVAIYLKRAADAGYVADRWVGMKS